jgi:hypothetical protein
MAAAAKVRFMASSCWLEEVLARSRSVAISLTGGWYQISYVNPPLSTKCVTKLHPYI